AECGGVDAPGVVDGCRRGPIPWLVIRGISDFGDELKDDRFHAFASCAAAAVLHDFLAHGLDLGEAHPGASRRARVAAVEVGPAAPGFRGTEASSGLPHSTVKATDNEP